MNKTILTSIALLALAGVSNAQVSGFNVGYCLGEMGSFPSTTDEYFSAMSTQKQAWTSGAILLPAERVKMLVGNEIREIHTALVSKLNVDSLSVWIRQDLDGENLAEALTTTPAKSWNTIALDSPLSVTEAMGALYVGYSYHQKSTSKAMSVIESPVPGYSCFVMAGEGEWSDWSETYALCVEALVYGDNLPKCDLTLEAISVQPNYVVDEGTLAVTAKVRNNATHTITGFDAQCYIDGIDIDGVSHPYVAHIDCELPYGEVQEFSFVIRPTGIQSMDPAERQITVLLNNLAEGEDENIADNSLSGKFSVTLHSFVRNVLLEEFTTERCPNCPRVAAYVHAAMESADFAGRLNTIEHHAGYYTDQFTTTFDNAWRWFYDNEYAPAIMYDRYAEPGAVTAISNPSGQQELFDNIRRRLREPAFVSLKVTAHADEENQNICVRVSGTRAKEEFTRQAPRITVVLTETNLKALSQAGATGEYIHYNVGRRVNSNWGDVLEWEGDDYVYECELPYNQNYVMENLGVLAFIHDYDPDDKTKCDVANSMAITADKFGQNEDEGISNIAADSAVARYYDVNGHQLQAPKQGLNIVVRGSRVTKELH